MVNLRALLLGIGAGAALVVAVGASADESRQEVHGTLESTNVAYGAHGDFHVESDAHDSVTVETLRMDASGLGVRPDADGTPAAYHVVLVPSSGPPGADFGTAELGPDGHVRFRFDGRFDAYPSGVTTLTSFGGGTFEVRRDDVAVLSGAIPQFPPPPSPPPPGMKFHGKADLTATLSGAGAFGRIDVHVDGDGKHPGAQIKITAHVIGTLGAPFTVVAVAGGGAETTLGALKMHGRSGDGDLTLDTRHGGVIPGGGVAGLSGETIEVRNSLGVAVLTGVFPTVP